MVSRERVIYYKVFLLEGKVEHRQPSMMDANRKCGTLRQGAETVFDMEQRLHVRRASLQ